MDSDPALQFGARSWVLPAWARLWIVLAPDPIHVTIHNRKYPSLRAAMLFGVTSRAMPVSAYGGVTIAVDIGPLAWARLFQPSAEVLRDRITPLDELLPRSWSEDLIACVERSDRGAQVKSALDNFFLERIPPPHPQEQLISRISALLGDERTHDLADAAAQVGIDKRALLGLTKRYFGFPPKMLLMRTRFLRALTAMMLQPDAPNTPAIPAGYHDASHFIRDSNRFLGMTPRRFLAINMPYTRAALRARMLVTGSPMSALDTANMEH